MESSATFLYSAENKENAATPREHIIWPLTFDLPSMFRAAGDVRFPMIVSIIFMWLFRLLTGYLLSVSMQMGVLGIWIAMTVDRGVRALVFVWRYFSGRWNSSG